MGSSWRLAAGQRSSPCFTRNQEIIVWSPLSLPGTILSTRDSSSHQLSTLHSGTMPSACSGNLVDLLPLLMAVRVYACSEDCCLHHKETKEQRGAAPGMEWELEPLCIKVGSTGQEFMLY